MNKNANIWIYDIETLKNFFSYTAINRDTKEVVKFVIWQNKNQLKELLAHLSICRGQIGYNNINFDYPILHYILLNKKAMLSGNGDRIARAIYKKAQETIQAEYSSVREEEWEIHQLDLFRIWHFNNKARITSLKKLEINLNFPNVQDMPYSHTEEIKTESQVEEILDYNLNDVEATLVFYEKTKDKINLRKGLIKRYGLNCINYPDSKIGEDLMLKLYCEATGKEEYVVRRMRTHRKSFKFKECVPPYIKFETPEFQGLLEYIKSIEVTELKDSFKYSFEYGGFVFELGSGGIHGCIKAGVYKDDENTSVVDCDVSSLYPSLAITLGLYPEHLGEEFLDVYENELLIPRIEAKKNGDKVMNEGFKLSLNSIFGKSNSEYSWVYDPLYTIKTTLAGQLGLCMLSEMIMTRVPNLTMLQINTDGITVTLPNDQKRNYWNICKEWESITKLNLEYVSYSQMIIRDVNNYIAVSKDNKIKYKGAFKPNHEMLKGGEYNKSFSQGIVALAVSDYFLKDVPVEATIRANKDIYLFCKTVNLTHGWKCETFEVDEQENELNITSQQKTNRYFMSKSGVRFRKTKEERKIEVEAGKKVIIFNRYYEAPMEEYDIDFDYYVDECYKIINKINGVEEQMKEEARILKEAEKREKEAEKYIKYCLQKIPTERIYSIHKRDWLIEKYGEPSSIKPSKIKKVVTNLELLNN